MIARAMGAETVALLEAFGLNIVRGARCRWCCNVLKCKACGEPSHKRNDGIKLFVPCRQCGEDIFEGQGCLICYERPRRHRCAVCGEEKPSVEFFVEEVAAKAERKRKCRNETLADACLSCTESAKKSRTCSRCKTSKNRADYDKKHWNNITTKDYTPVCLECESWYKCSGENCGYKPPSAFGKKHLENHKGLDRPLRCLDCQQEKFKCLTCDGEFPRSHFPQQAFKDAKRRNKLDKGLQCIKK